MTIDNEDWDLHRKIGKSIRRWHGVQIGWKLLQVTFSINSRIIFTDQRSICSYMGKENQVSKFLFH